MADRVKIGQTENVTQNYTYGDDWTGYLPPQEFCPTRCLYMLFDMMVPSKDDCLSSLSMVLGVSFMETTRKVAYKQMLNPKQPN